MELIYVELMASTIYWPKIYAKYCFQTVAIYKIDNETMRSKSGRKDNLWCCTTHQTIH